MENSKNSRKTLLFITRGNSLQIFDYKSKKIIKDFILEAKKSHLNIKSFYSSTKKFYCVYGKKDYYIIKVSDFSIVKYEKLENGSIEFINFLDKENEFFTVVQKLNSEYSSILYKMEKVPKKLFSFKASFFKTNLQYIKLSKKANLIFFQKTPNTIITYNFKNPENFEISKNLKITEKKMIHNFLSSETHLYTITNADNKEINSVTKIYKIEKSLNLECERIFKNVQELKFVKNPDFSLLIISAHQYQDKTGKSYYGREKIFRYNYEKKVFEEIITFFGVIHNLSLDSNFSKICAISGKMPAHCVLYKKNMKPDYLLTHDFKNRVYFSNGEKFIAICAFGSLNGKIEIYDCKSRKFVAGCSSSHSSFLKWSSDAEFFLTAVIAEKLKVDHRISVFSVDGKKIENINFQVFDLISVDFVDQTLPDPKFCLKEKKKNPVSFGLSPVQPEKPGTITEYKIKQSNPNLRKKKRTAPTLTVGTPKLYKGIKAKTNQEILNKWKNPPKGNSGKNGGGSNVFGNNNVGGSTMDDVFFKNKKK